MSRLKTIAIARDWPAEGWHQRQNTAHSDKNTQSKPTFYFISHDRARNKIPASPSFLASAFSL
jgi:hypothetical protein